MKVRILSPCLGKEVGAVVEVSNIGVARTLISFGKVEEHKDEPKLDSSKVDKPKQSSRKSSRSKKSS